MSDAKMQWSGLLLEDKTSPIYRQWDESWASQTWTHLGPIFPFSCISLVLTQRVDWQGPLTAKGFERGFASNKELCSRVSSSQASAGLKQPPAAVASLGSSPLYPLPGWSSFLQWDFFPSGAQTPPPLLPATVLRFGKPFPIGPHPLWFAWHWLYDVLGKWLVDLNLALITWPTVSSWS